MYHVMSVNTRDREGVVQPPRNLRRITTQATPTQNRCGTTSDKYINVRAVNLRMLWNLDYPDIIHGYMHKYDTLPSTLYAFATHS